MFIGLTNDEILYMMHVGLIFISIPQFLTNRLIDILIIEVGHMGVSIGMLGSSVYHNCQHIQVGEGRRCLGHNSGLTAIAVCCAKILFQLLHNPGNFFRGS